MKPKFEASKDGLEIIDQIERHRYRLTTHKPVSPKPVNTDQIQYPIDAAVGITTEMITLPTNDTVYIRGDDGSMVAEARPITQTSLPENEYTLDLFGPLKTFVKLNSSLDIYSDGDQTHINLGKSTDIILGARSYHTRPAGTVTTSTDPTDVMQAISAFGSALKAKTPERSYPTLRGHPPTIKLGDQLSIPEVFSNNDGSIKIEIPPNLKNIFVITPLAYYLGARVVPSSDPKLTIEDNYSYSLDTGIGFEETVEQLLKQIFFLDCIIRTEGVTPLPIYERKAVEKRIDFDFETVYDLPLTEQLKIYLKVPFAVIESHIPEWRLKAQLKPDIETIEFLPFITYNLPIIKTEGGGDNVLPATPQTNAIEQFTRGNGLVRGGELVDNSCDELAPTIRQIWNTETSTKIPSVTPLSAFYNNLGRTPRKGPIDIEVVCNDSDMQEELETVNGVYGDRDELPFEVTINYKLSKSEFKRVLAQERDFLHYIGHIDDDGFQCSDGKLDASTVETVGSKAFFLNACQSHDQGLRLVEAGSIGGIVTIGEIINSGAVRVGCTIARLLDCGYSLYAALSIARKQTVVGEQYRIVGDGTTTIAQSKTDAPNMGIIRQNGDDIYFELIMYTGAGTGKGSLFSPHLENVSSYYILPKKSEIIPVSKSQLREFLDLSEIPVLINGSLKWSSNVNLNEL